MIARNGGGHVHRRPLYGRAVALPCLSNHARGRPMTSSSRSWSWSCDARGRPPVSRRRARGRPMSWRRVLARIRPPVHAVVVAVVAVVVAVVHAVVVRCGRGSPVHRGPVRPAVAAARWTSNARIGWPWCDWIRAFRHVTISNIRSIVTHITEHPFDPDTRSPIRESSNAHCVSGIRFRESDRRNDQGDHGVRLCTAFVHPRARPPARDTPMYPPHPRHPPRTAMYTAALYGPGYVRHVPLHPNPPMYRQADVPTTMNGLATVDERTETSHR